MRASVSAATSRLGRVLSLSSLLLAAACGDAGLAEDPQEAPPAAPAGAVPDLYLTLVGEADEYPMEECARGVADALPLPAVVQVVVDTSRSMAWPPGWAPDSDEPPVDCESKWDITRAALTSALDDLPETTLLGMNLYPNVANSAASCIRNEVALPLDVLGSSQSPQRRALASKLESVEPRGGTPTHAAYRFGLQALESKTLRGNRFLVLITDGAPNYTASCAGGSEPVDSAPLVAEAARAFARGVRTYVVGSPGSEAARSALSRVAHAGGTGAAGCSAQGPTYCHFDMTGSRDLGRSLKGALAQVSEQLTSCEYTIPAAPSDGAVDGELVNVIRTDRDGQKRLLLRAGDGRCDDGWTYSADGRRIVLCAETCLAAQREPGTRVEVLFGCQSAWRRPH